AQKVTGREARHSLGALTAAFSGPAPGPSDGLRLPPDPERLAAAPYHAFHQMGVERRRADTIRRAAREAPRLERLARFDAEQGMRRLVSLPGVGEWTAAETVALSHGHPDAVPVGDFHVPNTVAWLLATEPRGDDRRMLELLEEFRPQRGRVIRLLEATGGRAPAFGPRLPVRSITGI
ncbi:MAG: DNA-3-methyladenine glycosylase family protein, partial [Acidimicrobiia bacterium]